MDGTYFKTGGEKSARGSVPSEDNVEPSLNQRGGQEDNPSSLCRTTKVELDNASIKTKGLRLPNCEKRESIKLGLNFPYGSKKESVIWAAGLQRWHTEVDPCWHVACTASKDTEHQMASLTGTTHCSECWLARYRVESRLRSSASRGASAAVQLFLQVKEQNRDW